MGEKDLERKKKVIEVVAENFAIYFDGEPFFNSWGKSIKIRVVIKK